MNMRHLTLKISFIFLLLFAFSALPSLQAQDLPDLVITDIQFSPEQPNPQEIVTVTATVQNIGSSVANAFRVTFNANITLTKEVPSLAPDASTIVRFSWFGPEGEHTIRIEANPFDDVEESNKENNFLEKNILVARDPLPDFVVERVTITPENPLPREEAIVEITVKNIGTLASSRALMEVRDDQGVLGRPRINALEPDQTETVSLTWRPLEGERRLTIKVDDITTKNDLAQFDLTFEETTLSDTDEAYVQDQRVTMDFEVDAADLAAHHGMGLLQVVVSYSETSGIPFDGCDTVTAAIPPSGPSADWGNTNSVLTGTSDDCSDIVLTVVVFPAYTGEAIRVAGGEASDHEAAWSSQTQGVGTFTLDLDVSASSPGPPPSPQDDGEAVSVTWTVTFYDVTVEEA